MKKNKVILTIIFACTALIIIIGTVLFIRGSVESSSEGSITIEFVNEENVISKNIKYDEGDTLQGLITDNFKNVYFDNTGFLLNIEDYETPSNYETFVKVYVDGKESEVGINQIEFEKYKKISLIVSINEWM